MILTYTSTSKNYHFFIKKIKIVQLMLAPRWEGPIFSLNNQEGVVCLYGIINNISNNVTLETSNMLLLIKK